LEAVVPKGDYEVTFQLKRPQPAFIALLASGFTPIYPCHVPAREMRQHPIGTGPFKFVEFKPNEYIKVVRNPDYWKKDRPYLDGIDWTIIKNQATGQLAFLSGQFDMTSPYFFQVPLINDTQKQDPNAICKLVPSNVNRNVMINRTAPPFNNAELRRAVALTIDRRAFIDTLTQGKGDIGGAMLPQPAGIWGMPPEMLATVPGYGPDVQKNRAEARALMEKLGYGPDKRLEVKISTRNVATYRDPAVILIDQLKDIYIDGALDTIETANWHTKVTRKDYSVALNATGSGVDDQSLRIERDPSGEAARYARITFVGGDSMDLRLALGALAEPARAGALCVQIHQRRFEAADAAEVRGDPNRSAAVAADATGREACGDGRRFTAARSSRRAIERPRVVRPAV
jgi:peptide/nickel transport system substrate-binding protein